MTAVQFCYWLQGYVEIGGANIVGGLSADQMAIVKNHLAMVFAHDLDPKAGGPAEQAKLNALHDGTKSPIVRPRC